MSHEKIRDLLQKLHHTLTSTTTISDGDRKLLEQLSADIHALLAESGRGSPAEGRSVVERLRTTITRFEVSHPDLTATLGQISKTLADMGI